MRLSALPNDCWQLSAVWLLPRCRVPVGLVSLPSCWDMLPIATCIPVQGPHERSSGHRTALPPPSTQVAITGWGPSHPPQGQDSPVFDPRKNGIGKMLDSPCVSKGKFSRSQYSGRGGFSPSRSVSVRKCKSNHNVIPPHTSPDG